MSSTCITPYMVKGKMAVPQFGNMYQEYIPVPCGKCPPCLKKRVSGWSFRLVQQGEVSTSALFITLTYATGNLHVTKSGKQNLCKRDLQLFFKRLRKAHEKSGITGIKYYAVGEYGTESDRPHYHIILFNADWTLIESSWGLGIVHYGTVTGGSIGYTLKYTQKPGRVPVNKTDDRAKEFAIMSKGLGASYLTEAMVKWHKEDLLNRMYVNIEGGKKIAMPRYYKEKIYSEEERDKINQHIAAKFNESDLKLRKELGGNFYFVIAQRAISQFGKMHIDAVKNRTTI